MAKIRQGVWGDYRKAANLINRSPDIDMVYLQHEYGIYGGKYGDFALKLLREVKRPIITTLHTVTTKPNAKNIRIIRALCKRSSFVAVMLEETAKNLQQNYGVPLDDVVVIPHGIPNFSIFNTQKAKAKLNLSGKVVMTSINLLSHHKGIEHAIKSLPEMVKKCRILSIRLLGKHILIT